MTDYTIDINQDGVVDAQDDLNSDGVTDTKDARQFAEDSANEKTTEDDELKRFGVPKGFVPRVRERRLSSTKPDASELFGGSELLDENAMLRSTDIKGKLLPLGTNQGLYDTNVDSMDLLYALSYDDRSALTDFLYSKGFYGSSKPSVSRLDKTLDGRAVGQMLAIANQMGRTWDYAQSWIANNTKTVYGGVKVGAVTPLEDRKKRLNTESVNILGRRLAPPKLDKAAEMIAQRERANDKTSLTTMAETTISKQNPELESANRFAKGVDIFRSMLGGG